MEPRAVIVLMLTLWGVAQPAVSAQSVFPITPAEPPVLERAADRMAILSEVSAYHRDREADSWPAIVDHFLPAKVTARWAPPLDDFAWTISEAEGTPAIAIVGAWARVMDKRPVGSGGRGHAILEEFWLLDVQGRWKIVHLVSQYVETHLP